MNRSLLKVLVVATAFTAATPAHAYVDPGAGSLLLQLVLGGVAGGRMVLRLVRMRVMTRLRSFFGRRSSRG